MKIKSVLASLSACAIAVAAMAIPASAAITNPNDSAQMTYNINETDSDWKNISGAKVTLTMADGWEESGAGGGVVFQGEGVAWADGAKEFGFSGEGEDVKNVDGVTIAANGKTITVTYDWGSAIFANATEEGWGQFIIQSWWGGDFSVDNVEFVHVGGNTEESRKTEESKTEESKTEESKTEESKTEESRKTEESKSDNGNAGGSKNTQTTGTNTGDAGVGIAVAGLALAGAAAFAARRKH